MFKMVTNDKEYIINLLTRELKKVKKRKSNDLHNYDDRVSLLENTIRFLETDT